MKKELKEKVQKAIRLRTKDQLERMHQEEIVEKFLNRQNQFNSEYFLHNKIRALAHAQLTEADVMTDFLVNLSEQTLAEAAKPLPTRGDVLFGDDEKA